MKVNRLSEGKKMYCKLSLEVNVYAKHITAVVAELNRQEIYPTKSNIEKELKELFALNGQSFMDDMPEGYTVADIIHAERIAQKLFPDFF